MECLRSAAGVGRVKEGTTKLVVLLLRVGLIHGELARVHHHPFHFMVGGVAPARGSPATNPKFPPRRLLRFPTLRFVATHVC